MRFTIGKDLYDLQALDRLTLAEILRLEGETASLGRPMKWSQIRAMAVELDGLTPAEFEEHDDAMWVIALGIWTSRLRKGENLTLAEAIDFPLSDLTFLPEPEDRKSADPRKARKGSAAGAKRATAKAQPKTSEPASSPA